LTLDNGSTLTYQRCMQFMGDYWLQHIRPDYMADFAQGLDKGIHKLFQMCIGIYSNLWTDFAKERMHSPFDSKAQDYRNHSTDAIHSALKPLLRVSYTSSTKQMATTRPRVGLTSNPLSSFWERTHSTPHHNHLGRNCLMKRYLEPTTTLQTDYDMPGHIYKATSKPLLHQRN
jgi:hypothetical protein